MTTNPAPYSREYMRKWREEHAEQWKQQNLKNVNKWYAKNKGYLNECRRLRKINV
jgi:hypothetical protein